MSLEQLWGLGRLLRELTCGNCRGRLSSLSEIMQIVTSAVRVLCLTQISNDDADHHLFSYFRASSLEPKFSREFEACVSSVQPAISGAFKKFL